MHLLAALAAVAMTLAPMPSAGSPLAQEPPPPALGSPILEDPLNKPGLLRTDFCPTGRNSSRVTDEGYVLKVTGACTATATSAYIVRRVGSVTMPDGELSVEVKFVAGVDRALLRLWFRLQREGAYVLTWEPARGLVQLSKAEGGQSTVLQERIDPAAAVAPDVWARVAMRAEGPNLWVLVNERPIVSAVDATFETGSAGSSALIRMGDMSDEAETTVVLRNLRVSPLAGGDSARAPTSRPSSIGAAGDALVPPVGTPPEVGKAVLENTLVSTRQVVIPNGSCTDGVTSIEPGVEGVVFRVTGLCDEEDPAPLVETDVPGLTVPDGEIRFEMKVLSGLDRATLLVYARETFEDDGGSYAAALLPGSGSAAILRFAGESTTILGRRSDLGALFKPDEWNGVAVRLDGPNLWLLVNDRPVLSAVDSAFSTGGVAIRLVRQGDPDDEEPVAVVLRNLRISSLVGAGPSRTPTYEPSSRAALASPDGLAER